MLVSPWLPYSQTVCRLRDLDSLFPRNLCILKDECRLSYARESIVMKTVSVRWFRNAQPVLRNKALSSSRQLFQTENGELGQLGRSILHIHRLCIYNRIYCLLYFIFFCPNSIRSLILSWWCVFGDTEDEPKN